MTRRNASVPPWGALAGPAIVVLLVAAHVALSLYFVHPAMLGASSSPLNDAFAIAVYRLDRARLALSAAPGTAGFYGYDAQVLAGQIGGLTEPFGPRLLAIAVMFAHVCGVSPVRAFNGALLALHLGFPFLGYAAARAFGLARRAAVIVFAFWSFAWCFDALVHYSWYSGRIEWIIASGVAVCATGIAWRLAAGAALASHTVGLVVLLAAATLIAPAPALFVVLLGVLPLALGHGLLTARRATLGLGVVVPVILVVCFGAAAAPLSAEPLVRVYRASLLEPLWDALEVLGPGNGAPGAARTLMRTFVFVAAVVRLRGFRAVSDKRAVPLAGVVLGGLVAAYAGGFVPVAWPADPYFLLVPALLAATVPAALLLTELRLGSLLREGALPLRVGLAMAAIIVVPRIARTVTTYVPELLPTRVERAALDYRVSALVGLNEPMPDRLGHDAPPAFYGDVVAFLSAHEPDRGRIVVDDPALAAFLATRSSLPVLGPIAERGAPSADADPTPLLDGAVDGAVRASLPGEAAMLRAYLERYAVAWVVLTGAPSAFDRAPLDVLGPLLWVQGARLRRVLRDPNYFVAGRGRVVTASAGSIRIAMDGKATDARVVLRFHYDPRLRCRPGCAVARVPADGDRAGFVAIDAAPPAFELYVP